MQIISGISDPDTGTIRLNDQPLQLINKDILNCSVGYSLSINDILQGTIYDNIVMGRDYIDMKGVEKAIRITELADFIGQQAQGLYTVIDPEGSRVPRSIRNKILLSRAIACNPKLLILEDPLDHLNRQDKEKVIKNLCSTDHHWSIIVATVDDLWFSHINNKIILDKGRISEISIS